LGYFFASGLELLLVRSWLVCEFEVGEINTIFTSQLSSLTPSCRNYLHDQKLNIQTSTTEARIEYPNHIPVILCPASQLSFNSKFK